LNQQQEEDPSPAATRRRPVAAHWQQAAREQYPDASDEEITRAAEELRGRHNSETATRAIGVRLAREDPNAMTAPARASSRHVKSLARWEQAAREQHPGADQSTVTRVAEELRREYFRRLARRSVETRREAGTILVAANASGRSVKSMARWEQAAREQHPGADQATVTRIAEELRTAFYSQMGRRSAAVRRAAAASARAPASACVA
jgi:hypothetical protein